MRLGTTAFPPPARATPYGAFVASLRRGQQLGVQVLNAPIPARLGADDRWRLRETIAQTGIEFEPTCPANYCSSGDEAKRVQEKVIGALEQARDLGAQCLRTMAQRTTNRFTKDPPLGEQLDRIATNLRPIVAAAADLGLTVALENHCDYRGSEIAEVIRAVDAPNFGAALDTANAFTSFEDPADAAQALAPYARTTHLKDFRIAPLGLPGKAPWIPVGCALGEGNVDLLAIVALLAQTAPDPQGLPLVVEVNWPPEGHDTIDLMVRSMAFIRQHLGDYLTGYSQPSRCRAWQ